MQVFLDDLIMQRTHVQNIVRLQFFNFSLPPYPAHFIAFSLFWERRLSQVKKEFLFISFADHLEFNDVDFWVFCV